MGQFKMVFCILIPNGFEYDAEATVDYQYHPGWVGSSISPPESADIEITGITVAGETVPDWMFENLCTDEDVLSYAWMDWRNCQADAEDQRAEYRRDLRDEERHERREEM